MIRAHLFQIAYDDKTRASADPGFALLNNSENLRPDWFEYWPIRLYFHDHGIVDQDYYGFFSPRFGEKTGLKSADVMAAVRRAVNSSPQLDLIHFSPYYGPMNLYVSPFEQGEAVHPGLLAVTRRFLRERGLDYNIDYLVTCSDTEIYCNYFVARGSVWRRWARLGEELFDLAEHAQGVTAAELRAAVRYRDGIEEPMKVFVMERLIALLAGTDRSILCQRVPVPTQASANSGQYPHFDDAAVTADMLKRSFIDTGERVFLDAFIELRLPYLSEREEWISAKGTA